MESPQTITLLASVLSWLLLAQVLAVLFYDGFGHAFSVGGMYFVVSASLNLAGSLSVRLERAQISASEGSVSTKRRWFTVPQSSLFVMAAYIAFFLSVLNILTMMPYRKYEWPVSNAIVFASAFLFYAMLKLPGRPFEKGEGAIELWAGVPQRPSYVYAIVVLLAWIPIVVALLHTSYYALRKGIYLHLPSLLRLPGVCLVSITVLSLLFASLLFRPRKLHVSRHIKKKLVFSGVVFVCVSFLAELSGRQDWYLFSFSLLSFVGLTAGSMRLWIAISGAGQKSGRA